MGIETFARFVLLDSEVESGSNYININEGYKDIIVRKGKIYKECPFEITIKKS